MAQAFASFAEAAGSLETSYSQLQTEVACLRQELETTNRDLERSLAENQRFRIFLGRILEGLPCGVLVVGAAGELRMANPEARRLLNSGGDGASILPQLLDQLTDECRQHDSADFEWEMNSGEAARCLGVRRANLAGEGGAAAEAVLILRDKTEEKRLQEEREKAQRTQALAELAMLLAHEIRNPLASLELFAGLLADVAAERPEARPWVDHLQAGLRLLAATVNNVLQFHSQPGLQAAPANVVRLVGELAGFLQPLARQRQMKVEFTAPDEEMVLSVDSHRLRQVFMNMALNALRAMDPGGTLRILVERGVAARDVGVRFEDQGRGIAPEDLRRIFEPGFTTAAGSPGLGLAVCRSVVEQHGGWIEVQSVPGEGSAFTVHLPEERCSAGLQPGSVPP